MRPLVAILQETFYDIKPLNSGESYQNTKVRTVLNGQTAGLMGLKRGTKSSPKGGLVKPVLHSLMRSVRRL
jgi:hypothetical protein